MWLFTFRKTKQPDAGAEAYAPVALQETPRFPLLRGVGQTYNPVFLPTPPPPAYTAASWAYLNSLGGAGGVIAGQLFTQPLAAKRNQPQ